MIGIYKYTNKYNNHCYIGQSINIEARQYNHRSAAYNEKAPDYNSQFHQAVRKYGGFDAFDFEILITLTKEEYSPEILNKLEKLFIKQYDSFQNGYNATEGGENVFENRAHLGSSNGRAKLNEEDVLYIRECYNNHVPFREVYSLYKDRISERGLQKVWWFETWKHIKPEYHTEENKYWHSHQSKGNPNNK